MRKILKDQIWMVGDIRADGTIVMGDSILMMVECKSQNREKKANDQQIDKFSIHQPIEKVFFVLATRQQSLQINFNAVSLTSEVLISLLLNLG